MKINFLKLANYARWGGTALFGMLALAGLGGIIVGNYLHFITLIGSATMSYAIIKRW